MGVTPAVAWPTWDPASRPELLLQTGSPAQFNSTGLCDFWDTVGSPPYKYVSNKPAPACVFFLSPPYLA